VTVDMFDTWILTINDIVFRNILPTFESPFEEILYFAYVPCVYVRAPVILRYGRKICHTDCGEVNWDRAFGAWFVI
jgi:hypothetical protein